MINYDEHHKNITAKVSVSEFRKRLAHYIASVRYGDDWICIARRGHDNVYLVSQADIDLIWEKSDDLRAGPRDEKGHRTGFGLMHYLRESLLAERKSNRPPPS